MQHILTNGISCIMTRLFYIWSYYEDNTPIVFFSYLQIIKIIVKKEVY